MSKHLNLWVKENGQGNFDKFIKPVSDKENQDKLKAYATTIYRNYKQNCNEEQFRENKIVSASVVIVSCALILLSRYFNLREKVQRPLEYMALTSILIFGGGFLYLLYQENEDRISGKSEKYDLDHEAHAKMPEVQTIMKELEVRMKEQGAEKVN